MNCTHDYGKITDSLYWYFKTGDIKHFDKFASNLKSNFRQKEVLPKWIVDELKIKPQSFVQIAYNRFQKRLLLDFEREYKLVQTMIESVYSFKCDK